MDEFATDGPLDLIRRHAWWTGRDVEWWLQRGVSPDGLLDVGRTELERRNEKKGRTRWAMGPRHATPAAATSSSWLATTTPTPTPTRTVPTTRRSRNRNRNNSTANPNFPPTTPDELDALQQDFPRTSTSSISTVDNTSNVVKATFQPQLLSSDTQRRYREAPWARTFHLNERNLVWSDDFKRRLLKKVAAEELDVTEDEVEGKLGVLRTLMPDAADKMSNMNIEALSALLDNLDELPERLLVLKRVFPEANASLLGIRSPWVLSRKFGVCELEAELQATADDLRELFPRLRVDKIVEENPECLDVEALKEAVDEARKMGVTDVERLMGQDPQALFSFQRGGRMISGGFD